MQAHHPRLAIAGAQLRGGGELHIVGSGDVLTIADPDGAIQHLLGLADGSRSRGEIVAALTGDFAQLGEDDVEHALSDLESLGVLVDALPYGRFFGSTNAPIEPILGRASS